MSLYSLYKLGPPGRLAAYTMVAFLQVRMAALGKGFLF